MDSYIDPRKEDFEAFEALPQDRPVNMLNLVRFREQADYGDGQKISGAEAYGRYRREIAELFSRVGATILWHGRPELMLIGPADEKWDLAFVARYPTAAAFLKMINDPIYKQAVRHRQAALVTSRLVRCCDL